MIIIGSKYEVHIINFQNDYLVIQHASKTNERKKAFFVLIR